MFHRWAAPVLVLALCAFTPKHAAGQQTQQPRGHGAGVRAYPNPFNPDIHILFSVGDENCPVNAQHVVTVRVLNILAQPVVFPVLFGPAPNSTTSVPSSLHGRPLQGVTLGCGDYDSYWDGKLPGSGRTAASGVYIVQVITDGKTVQTTRIYFSK